MVFRSKKGRQLQKEINHTERLVTLVEPANAASEAYRRLRTNLLYSVVDTPLKVIVITSPGYSEGKSITCANLGAVLAEAAKSTLIVDCDFRRPSLHKFFRLPNLFGIADVLSGEQSLQKVWTEPVEGLKVVTVGAPPPNPAKALGSQGFSEFLDGARKEFEYILVDSPPVRIASDAAILASHQGNGTLLVLDAQNTQKRATWEAIRILETAGANILGTVLDNVETAR